ncbi:MAG: NAD-dependent deacylase [Gemmatimonadales bacterium]
MSEAFEIEPDLVAALRSCRHLAVLTGAGISAESGIPTFREALTGVWSEYDPEELATPEGFARNPDRVWGWYRSRRTRIAEAEPNPGHRALAELERRVPSMTLVTQNIDGLHLRAGHRDVIELHGNIGRVRCSVEGTVVERFEDGDRAPGCPTCGAPLRPDVIWFGELLPRAALERAWAAALSADLFLSIGTSNIVEPAASLPWAAAQSGARVVVINTTSEGQRRGPGIRHLVGPAGEVLPALVRAAWPRGSTPEAPGWRQA